MKTALSLNGCAQRLGAHPRGVQLLRFDLFMDFTKPERSEGETGQALCVIPDACLGQALPDTRHIVLFIAARRHGDGVPVISGFSAS